MAASHQAYTYVLGFNDLHLRIDICRFLALRSIVQVEVHIDACGYMVSAMSWTTGTRHLLAQWLPLNRNEPDCNGHPASDLTNGMGRRIRSTFKIIHAARLK